jgi:hypothetical protein
MGETIRKIVDAFLPSGVERSRLGTRIEVSSNGTTTVPPSEYEKIVFRQFADMKRVEQLRSGVGRRSKNGT